MIASPASSMILFPAMYSNELPVGIGKLLIRKTVFEPAESFISTVICPDVVFARVRPITTVVVEDGGSWIDVPSDEIGTFIHYSCYDKVVEEIRQEQYKEMNNA